MTTEEIDNSEIRKAIYINGKWKVSIKHNNLYYNFRIQYESNISDSDLSRLVYDELLNTDILIIKESNQMIINSTLVGTKPKLRD